MKVSDRWHRTETHQVCRRRRRRRRGRSEVVESDKMMMKQQLVEVFRIETIFVKGVANANDTDDTSIFFSTWWWTLEIRLQLTTRPHFIWNFSETTNKQKRQTQKIFAQKKSSNNWKRSTLNFQAKVQYFNSRKKINFDVRRFRIDFQSNFSPLIHFW